MIEFFDRFPNEEACLRHVFEVRFGDHSPCPRCGRLGGWFPVKGTKKYSHTCRRHVSILEETVFYRSNLSLMAWFYAILIFANSSIGARASFLRRQLGIGVKSAHRMANSIRAHIADFEPLRPIGGPGCYVHIDETLIRNVRMGERPKPHIVMGIACEGEVRCGVLPNRKLETITTAINRIVRPDSVLVTDCHLAYSSLARDGWEHIPINHARAFHNFAGITNNPIEVYWGVLKRTLRLYGRVAPDNLWRYLAETQFRYNRRKATASPFLELTGAFPNTSADSLLSLRRNFEW